MSPQKRDLRVLVITLGRRGGVTEYGLLMARALAEQCHVAVISSSAAENRERWQGVHCEHLEVDTFGGLAGMLFSFFNVRRFARIRRFARGFAPDVVYYPGGHAWKIVLDRILPRATIVLTVHDPQLHAGEDSLAHRAFGASNQLKVDGYVLLNHAQRDAFIAEKGLLPAQVAVVEHGVFDHLIDARRPLGEIDGLDAVVPYDGTYALFVGRIQPYKGLEVLLDAYLKLSVTPDVPLVIAGSGQLSLREQQLLARLEGRPVVVVNRWLSDAEIASLVAAAKFVVLPYVSGTQSGVIPLASAFGVPAIAAEVGGVAEQVDDGDTGLLFPTGDVEALAETMTRAFGMDAVSYEKMTSRCREYAQAAWAWDSLAGRLLDFFEQLRSPVAGVGPRSTSEEFS